MLEPGTFIALDPANRDILTDWLATAGTGTIDTVIDLLPRPWNVAGPHTIIGVFEKGKETASWLIVGYGARWTLARCGDGYLSNACATLGEALRLIDDAVRN
jgi:hypothetical protein